MNEKQDILGQRLHQEAANQSPPFSDLLHHRVMNDLKFAPSPIPPRAHSLRKLANPWLALAAIAAAVLLIFGKFNSPPPAPPKAVAIQMLPSLPSVDQMLSDTAGPINADLNAARFGYLDRDAHRFASFIADQLDVLPKPRRGSSSASTKAQQG